MSCSSKLQFHKRGALSCMMRTDRVDKESPLDERVMEAKTFSGRGNKGSAGQKGVNHGVGSAARLPVPVMSVCEQI